MLPLVVILPRPLAAMLYVSVKAWSGNSPEALFESVVPVTLPVPLNVATPDSSETFAFTGVVAPKKKTPFADAAENGPPICGSKKPVVALLSVPTTNP